MAFDKKGFTEWLCKPNPDSASCQIYPSYLELVEKNYSKYLDGMSPEEVKALDALLNQAVAEARAGHSQFRNEREWLAEGMRSAFRAYQRYKTLMLVSWQEAPLTHTPSALPPQSAITLGLLEGKMYLAPDAFPPEEYPLP